MNEDPRLLEMAMQIALLKEQIRVADVAYQHLHGEHKKLQAVATEAVVLLRRADHEANKHLINADADSQFYGEDPSYGMMAIKLEAAI